MSIENMFGDLDKIDILAETKTGEVVMVLVCNGFIDGSPETQKALLDKMEGYLNHTQSEEFQKEYGGWPVILLGTMVGMVVLQMIWSGLSALWSAVKLLVP